jgi:transposase
MSKARSRRRDAGRERHWREVIRAQAGSGRSVREFCRQGGVKEGAFYWWRRELARRKFHESRRLDAARMETALAWIGKLYAVEKDLRERCQGEWEKLSLEERAVRIAAEQQQRSRPLLDSFHAWLEAEAPKVLPKGPVRGAMEYTLSNWATLSIYPEDGWLDIDNNEGENSLRGLCLGRRNWLFCGSDRGGRAAAIHFSLLASCKRHGHDPWVYLRDVLTRLPAMLPGASEEELLMLLPHLWRPA